MRSPIYEQFLGIFGEERFLEGHFPQLQNQPITRWWQLKDVLCSPRSLGKWSKLTNIFQIGWSHQVDKYCGHLKFWIKGCDKDLKTHLNTREVFFSSRNLKTKVPVDILLMVQKSGDHHLGCINKPVNNRINYLHLNWFSRRSSEPSTVPQHWQGIPSEIWQEVFPSSYTQRCHLFLGVDRHVQNKTTCIHNDIYTEIISVRPLL